MCSEIDPVKVLFEYSNFQDVPYSIVGFFFLVKEAQMLSTIFITTVLTTMQIYDLGKEEKNKLVDK